VISSAIDHIGKLLLLEVTYLLVQYSSLFIFIHWIPADMFSEKVLWYYCLTLCIIVCLKLLYHVGRTW